MNPTRIAAAALLCLTTCGAFAQAAAAPKSDWSLTGNAGLFSDYRFRGFSQTGYKPAFQGGFDIVHSSGFYAGNWNSNVESGLYNGASLEMDFYAGYKRAFGDFGIDVGALYYYYPNSGANGTTKVKNGEIYVGGTWKMLSIKYYHAVTKYFSLGEPPTMGAPGTGAAVNTRGSGYLDISAAYDLGDGWGMQAHYGHQRVRNGRALVNTTSGPIFTDANSVDDYKLGVSKDLSGWVVGAALVGTSRKDFFRTAESNFTRPAGKTSAVVSLSKSF
jgi:uncharacterized protein (TIGR02001 family)